MSRETVSAAAYRDIQTVPASERDRLGDVLRGRARPMAFGATSWNRALNGRRDASYTGEPGRATLPSIARSSGSQQGMTRSIVPQSHAFAVGTSSPRSPQRHAVARLLPRIASESG